MYTQPAAYRALPGGPLDVDTDFYDRVATADRTLREDFVLPVRSGRAWVVPQGSICRIYTVDGPQVGDLNVWNLHDPRERFWASKTRQLQASSITTYGRLWSTLPFLRPLLTFTADTLADHPDAGVLHDMLGSRCDPYVNRLLTGTDFDYHCHSNLTRAVLPYGLTEFDVHDVINLFQFAGLNNEYQYFMDSCPARPGDYVEFFAEIDLLCALSTCPGGDLSVRMWGPDAATTEEQLAHCNPLGIQVHTIAPHALEGWQPPEPAPYHGHRGRHGLHANTYGEEAGE